MVKSKTPQSIDEKRKQAGAPKVVGAGVDKRKGQSKKKSNEIEDIFSLASTSKNGLEPDISGNLKAVAEEIKKAREMNLAVSSSRLMVAMSYCLFCSLTLM
jgi:hypothetical protein